MKNFSALSMRQLIALHIVNYALKYLPLVLFLLIEQSQISVSVVFNFSMGVALECFVIAILFDSVSAILILKSKIKGAADKKFFRRQSTIATS